jgi:hypothetical protein
MAHFLEARHKQLPPERELSTRTAQLRSNDCEHSTQTLLLYWSVCSVSIPTFLGKFLMLL